MSGNAFSLLSDTKHSRKRRLLEAINIHYGGSFLLDSNRLAQGQFEYSDEYTFAQYVNAQQIYDEFERVDNDLKLYDYYSPDLMLEVVEKLLGKRFAAFKRIYKKEYRVKPVSKKKYLKNAQQDLEKVLYKYEMDIAIEKWDDREKNNVTKAMVTLMNYYKSTGRFDLASTIEKEPIYKPKTFKQISMGWRKFHIVKMAKKCQITKKEARKHLNIIIKNTKLNF